MRWRIVAVAVLAGCTFDGRVEGEPNITCAEAADCPAGFFCQASVGRCIRLLSPGLEPPGLLGPAVVAPTLAARGVTVRVHFQVTEPLARHPTVRAVYSNGASVTLPVVEDGPTAGSYLAELRPTADAPEGAVRFFAELLDVDGAEAADLDLGAAVLDYTPPALVRSSATLTLTPSSTNPLSRVEAMNETTLAQLTFAVTEPLASAPVLSVSVAGNTQAFTVRYGSATGTSHLFWLTLAAGAIPQGTAALSVELEDLAGNRAALDLELKPPGLVVDSEAPVLGGLADGGVLLRRAPTGAAFRQGTRGTSVLGAPGTTEPGATLIASETPTSPDLARTTASTTGAFELTLPADVASVTVRALDGAGNQSPPALVQQVSWYASLSDSAPGAGNGNPHRALSTPVLGPTPEPWGALEHFGTSGLDAIGGATVVTPGGVNWRSVPGATFPLFSAGAPGEAQLVATWDPFRARAVLVWGSSDGVLEWNGAGWRSVTPTDPEGDGSPRGYERESRGGIAFDEDLRLTLVVTSSGAARVTWGWNGTSWVRLARDETTRCTGCTLAWDSRRRRVLLFDPPTGTTAAWNPGARTWEVLTVATSPTIQTIAPAMAFEHHTGRWIRFGGSPEHDETWVFDGTAWSLAADGGPSPRWGAIMGYDPLRRRVLLHGGATGSSGSTLGDTWEWNGTGWRAVADAGPARASGSMVAAPAFGETLVIGSGGSPLRLGGDGGWLIVDRAPSLLGRLGVSATYSPAHDAVILAGGLGTNGARTAEVGALGADGFFSLPTLPTPVHRGALAADPTTGRLFYVGGLGPDGGPVATTFATTDSGLWQTLDAGTRLPDGGLHPAPRSDAIVFFELQRGALVMVGGYEAGRGTNASFTLGPAGWVDGGLSGPALTEACLWGGSAALAPDGRTLFSSGFGSGVYASQYCSLQTSPSAQNRFWYTSRVDADLSTMTGSVNTGESPHAWDDGVGAWVAFGGRNSAGTSSSNGSLRALWSNQWTHVPFTDTDGDGSPGPRSRHGFGYVRALGRLRLYGGENGGQPSGDAWELQLAGSRPALLFRVQLQGALPRGATPVALRLEGVAGADDGDGGRPGVSVVAWHRHRWLEVSAVAAADGGTSWATALQPQAFAAEVRDPAVLADLLNEPTATFAVVPTSGFWRGPPRVGVDYLELRLDSTFPGATP